MPFSPLRIEKRVQRYYFFVTWASFSCFLFIRGGIEDNNKQKFPTQKPETFLYNNKCNYKFNFLKFSICSVEEG